MKILVTGSGGFIGSALIKTLAQQGKHQVLGVDKKFGVNIIQFDRLMNIVNKMLGKPDLILHLAAQTSCQGSFDRPHEDFQDNVMGTFNVLEMARLFEIPLIYTSSRKAEVGDQGQRSPYGLSKFIGELYIENYAKNYNVKYIINRMGNIYGPGQEGSPEAFFLAWFIKASILKTPVTVYGFKGEQSRDMLYIDDLMGLFLDQVENFGKYEGKTYKVAGGAKNELSIIQTLKILKYTNFNFGPAQPFDKKREVDLIDEVCAVNGWRPVTALKDGIAKTVEWYRVQLKKEKEGKK